MLQWELWTLHNDWQLILEGVRYVSVQKVGD